MSKINLIQIEEIKRTLITEEYVDKEKTIKRISEDVMELVNGRLEVVEADFYYKEKKGNGWCRIRKSRAVNFIEKLYQLKKDERN